MTLTTSCADKALHPTEIDLPTNALVIHPKPMIKCNKVRCVYVLIDELYKVNEQYEVQIKEIQTYVYEHNKMVKELK